MRISLVDREQQQKRRNTRRQRSGRYRTYNAAILMPQARPRRRFVLPRFGASSRTTGRASAAGSVSAVRVPILKRIGWRTLGSRLPAVLLLAGAIGLFAFVSIDANFFVYEAQIEGSKYIDSSAIYEAADIHEQHVFWVDPRDVAERISQVPGIKAVRVRCALPDQVSITVEERQPVMMWRTMSHSGDWWLDSEGNVLPYHGDPEAPGMVFVVDWSDRELVENGRIDPPELVRWVQRMAMAMPDAKLFYYQADRGLNFIQEKDGHRWPVYVGDGESLSLKIRSVQALSQYLATNHIHPSFVDVRWPELPVYGEPGVAPLQAEN